MGEIRALTGLRAIGAAWVMAFHICLALGLSDTQGVLLRGYLAVDLFFILSGFVLARSHGATFAHDRSLRTYVGFAAGRFMRLWPLYAVVTLAVVAIQAAWHESEVWPNQLAANLLMVQSWGLSSSIVLPGWSVSTEWAASLLLPLLAVVALQSRPAVAWATLAGAAGALVATALLARGIPHGRRGDLDVYDAFSLLPAVRCLAGTTVGLLVHRAVSHAGVARLVGGRWPALLAAALLVAGTSAGVADAWLYPLLALLVAGLACGGGAFAELLARLAGAGRLAYAVYLLHMPVMQATDALGLGAWWPLIPVAVLVLAVPAHLLVEEPARRWWRGHGWQHRPVQPALSRG